MAGKKEQPQDIKRREFIGSTILAAGVATVAPGVLLTVANATSEDEGANSEIRWGMLIDSNKCVDNCTACVDA
ncbi:MAG TPA: 4Fe-4S ferredoxin, partial [Gammaproteobacteria bacterium]|nr:4Fe-4S ferredoxin [Gammaproteobacteria bacterium]